MGNNLAPKLRFAGFTDAWEQCELGSIANRYDNLRVPVASNLRKSGSTPYYGANGIQDYVEGYTHDGEYVLVAEDGANDLKNYPVQYVSGKIWVNNHAHVIQGITKFADNRFLSYLLHQSVIEPLLVGGGRAKLNAEALMHMQVTLPKFEEQVEIGKTFASLDSLLTLHQRKYEQLKSIKKSLLQKMFPKDGENVPEIRFAGFTDAWEQHKLGDIAPLRGGFAFKSERYTQSGIPVLRISNILANGSVGGDYLFYEELPDDANFTLENGDAVLAMSGATTGKVSILTDYTGKKYYQNQRVGLFSRTKYANYKFISTIVRSEGFTAQLKEVLVAGAQPNVSSKDIDSFEFSIPKTLDEQSRIGEVFATLDSLLTLHQRKCADLKRIKKALLEQMFC